MKKFLIVILIVLLLICAFALKRLSHRSETIIANGEVQQTQSFSLPEVVGKKSKSQYTNLSPQQILILKQRKKFIQLLESSFIRLPTISSMRLDKDGSFHHVPSNVLQASAVFGEISESLKENSALTKDAIRFYIACTLNEQIVTSIRAVCARNLKDWAFKERIDVSNVVIPEEIERIAAQIPTRN